MKGRLSPPEPSEYDGDYEGRPPADSDDYDDGPTWREWREMQDAGWELADLRDSQAQ